MSLSEYEKILLDNYDFIVRQCHHAVASTHSAGNEAGDSSLPENAADELVNDVLERLQEDNFRALRTFRGEARVTTYITTIIMHQIVDAQRHRSGRSRARERAVAQGETAVALYDLIYTRGMTLADAQAAIELQFGRKEPFERLQELLARIQGRERNRPPVADGSRWLVPGHVNVDDEGDVDLVVPDPAANAEHQIIDRERRELVTSVLTEMVSGLSGEDRFLLRLRFPDDEDDRSHSMAEIAELVGSTERAVDARIRRMLTRLREEMLRRGLSLDDFIAS